MRLFLFAAALLATGAAYAAEPMMFAGSTWVCDTPEHYDAAAVRQRNGENLDKLRRELSEAGRCVFVENDEQDDILPPFVTLIEERDGKGKVAFVIQEERRISLLNREVAQIRYVGWTDATHIQTREHWRTSPD